MKNEKKNHKWNPRKINSEIHKCLIQEHKYLHGQPNTGK